MMFAAIGDGLYKALFLGHVVSFLVAFAPAVIHPILAAQAKADGEAVLVPVARHLADNGRRVHFPALVLVGGFGLAMVLASDDVWAFDQAWISLSFLVWLAICGIVSAVVLPNERRFADGDLAAEAKVAMGGQIATVLLLVMLYLMIWKPGA
jgi:uncharacterized membrane protein